MSRICVVCSSMAVFSRAIRAWSSAKNTAEPKRAAASSSRSGKLEASSTEATPCRSNSWNRALEKRHRADFDAFPRPRVRRRGRILEGGVRGPAGAAVFYRIEYFEHVRVQSIRFYKRRPRPLDRAHRLRGSDHAAARAAAGKHRNPHDGVFLGRGSSCLNDRAWLLLNLLQVYRFENWKLRRALARPYFLRSTTRGSRVRNPPRWITPRKSGS